MPTCRWLINRILKGYNMTGGVAVDVVNKGGQGGAFAAACLATKQHQAVAQAGRQAGQGGVRRQLF
jgi:hypothetical protein